MKKIIILFCTCLGAWSAHAQNNPNANPQVHGINAAQSPIQVGQTVTTTFDVGNSGSDPIPAGGASWNISFPPNITVDQASLFLDGGDLIFTPTWTVIAGTGTFLVLDVVGAGIPAMTFNGPQTQFTMTVQITGAVAGSTPLQQTSNALPNPLIAGNADAGDDNASGPIQVVPAGTLPVNLLSFTSKRVNEHTAQLSWEVSDPDRFSHFELERSADGQAFSKVATIKLSAAQQYEQDDDISQIRDKALYRLRMVDRDGTSRLSAIVALSRSGANHELALYPNPAADEVRVTGLTGDGRYTIYTMEGRLAGNGVLKAGKPVIAVNGLAAGAYWFRIEAQGQLQILKMLKQ